MSKNATLRRAVRNALGLQLGILAAMSGAPTPAAAFGSAGAIVGLLESTDFWSV